MRTLINYGIILMIQEYFMNQATRKRDTSRDYILGFDSVNVASVFLSGLLWFVSKHNI